MLQQGCCCKEMILNKKVTASLVLPYRITSTALTVMVGWVAQSVQRLAGWSRDRNLVGARFSAPVQTGPGAHPASCTGGTGSFLGGKEWPGRDADPPTPSSAMVMKGQSYTSTPHMGRTACTEPQCLYKGALYLTVTINRQHFYQQNNTVNYPFLSSLQCGIWFTLVFTVLRATCQFRLILYSIVLSGLRKSFMSFVINPLAPEFFFLNFSTPCI